MPASDESRSDAARGRYEQRVRRLEAFGHRGSTTDRERQAAAYLSGELSALGLSAGLESFAANRSLAGRLLLPVVVAAVGATFLWHLPLAAAAIGAIALVSLAVEQSARGDILSRLLPTRPSQNVTATLACGSGKPRLRLVLLGHYDTQRTGLLFSDAVWRRFASLQRRLPAVFQSGLLPLVLAMAIQTTLGIMAAANPAWRLPPVLIGAILVVYVCAAGLFAEWALRPHVPGASDNASGAAGVLSVAESWIAAPVDDVEAVFLLTGCEEVGLAGAAAWVDQHRPALRDVPTVFLNLDGLGFGPPRLLATEVPLAWLPVRYPPRLLETGADVAAECGIADRRALTVPGYTDGLALLVRGMPGVTIVGCQPDGWLPHWHQLTDDTAHMDFNSAWRGVEFARRLAARLARLPCP